MRSGTAFVLAVLLAIVLASGSIGLSSSRNDDSDHSNSASSSDDHDDKGSKDDSDKDTDSEKDTDDKDSGKDKDKDGDSGKDSSYAAGMKQRLQDEGLHIQQSSEDSAQDCAAHSYGEVRSWLQAHPCTGLDRAWYEVSDDHDNKAVLSVAWVEMPDAESAGELQTVVNRPGTGNVTELSKDDGPYQGVAHRGWYYRSGRDGDTFRSVQAEPLASSEGSREVARRAAGAAGAA